MGTRTAHAARTLAKTILASAALGLATTAALTAWSLHRAERALTQTTMFILDVDGSNFITTLSVNRWSTTVVIQLFAPRRQNARLEDLSADQLHERLAIALSPTVDAQLSTVTHTYGAADNPVLANAPSRFLLALSAPRTTPAGRWNEATYGWPMRCIAIPDLAFATGTSPFRAIASGNFRIVWHEAALSLALFAAPAAALSLAFFTLRPWYILRRRRARNLCTACAYPLANAIKCPECGTAA